MKKERPTTLPVYDSIAQAAGATGIPIRVFQSAKKNGCVAAFRSNRVFLAEFITWFFNHEIPPDPRSKLSEVILKREQHKERKDKVEADEAEQRVVPKAEARRALTKYAVGVRKKLLELPQRNALPLSLLKEPFAVEQKLNEEVRSVLSEVFRGVWGKIECPNCKKEIKP